MGNCRFDEHAVLSTVLQHPGSSARPLSSS